MMRKSRSLVERTAEKLRERIRSGYKPGDCLPALRELCETMGVSLNTLRAAQALLAREGLVDIQHGEGVFVRAPSQSLRIGVLSELNLLKPLCAYHRNLADETLQVLRERGMTPHLFCGTVQPGQSPEESTCPEFWEAAGHHRLDGAIILNFPAIEHWLLRIRDMTLPVVADFTPYAVHHADVRMVEVGLQALARHGARRIAALTTSAMDVKSLFEQTVLDLGLATDPRWFLGELEPALPGAGWEQFRQLWRASAEKPDGILILNDLLFSSAAQAIRELRIDVPGQLRVVTHAQREAELPPAPFPHTRIEFDPRDFALAFVDLLELRLAGKPPPRTPPRVPYRVVETDGESGGRKVEGGRWKVEAGNG
ncbi:MAG: GntR family transcriptional regulator [Lentisphaerae bacterium]|nr:GntR family transcriptional regulator [Lentisphaerota bacterium]